MIPKVKSLYDKIFASSSNVYTKTETDAKVDSAISSIEIGGRNLLLNSKEKRSATYTDGNAFIDYNFSSSLKNLSNTTFTFSIDIKGSVDGLNCDMYFRDTNRDLMHDDFGWRVTTKYKRYQSTVNLTKDISTLGLIRFRLEKAGTIYIKNAKLEIGNKATDWTPAPEDMFNALNDRLNKNELLQTTGQATTNAMSQKSVTDELNKMDEGISNAVEKTGDTLTGSLEFNNKNDFGAIRKTRTLNGTDYQLAVGLGVNGSARMEFIKAPDNVLSSVEVRSDGIYNGVSGKKILEEEKVVSVTSNFNIDDQSCFKLQNSLNIGLNIYNSNSTFAKQTWVTIAQLPVGYRPSRGKYIAGFGCNSAWASPTAVPCLIETGGAIRVFLYNDLKRIIVNGMITL